MKRRFEVKWTNLFGARLVWSRHATRAEAQRVADRVNDNKRTVFMFGHRPNARVVRV